MRQQKVTNTSEQTFYEHVKELRKRITWAALAFMIGGLVGYIYRQPAIRFLSRPAHSPLYYNTPAGGFNLIMEVAAICGLFVAIPILAYQLVRFLAPAWGDSIRSKHVFIITVLSAVLAAMGAAFGYYIMLPLSLHFFGQFAIAGVHPLISANSYLDFVVKCILTFIVIFQIPLAILFINKIKPLPPRKMLKWEKYVIVGSLLLAVVLPFTYDPLSQFILAVPIIFLYNLSLVMIVWTNHWTKRKTRKQERKAAKHQVLDVTPEEPEEPEESEEPDEPPAEPVPPVFDTPPQNPKPAPVAPQPALQTKTKLTMEPTTVRRNFTSTTTNRRLVDITLPRQHAQHAPNHLDLRNVLPQPANPPTTLDLDMGSTQQ